MDMKSCLEIMCRIAELSALVVLYLMEGEE